MFSDLFDVSGDFARHCSYSIVLGDLRELYLNLFSECFFLWEQILEIDCVLKACQVHQVSS